MILVYMCRMHDNSVHNRRERRVRSCATERMQMKSYKVRETGHTVNRLFYGY